MGGKNLISIGSIKSLLQTWPILVHDCATSNESPRMYQVSRSYFSRDLSLVKSIYCCLNLLLVVCLQCSLQAREAWAQSTILDGGVQLSGNQRANSMVTGERVTGSVASARYPHQQQQQLTQHGFSSGAPTAAWTPSSRGPGNSLITSTSATREPSSSTQRAALAPSQPRPPLKFTLTAGKYWKFNIKTNSLQASHGERELRLHGNDSAKNFIIDDDGWFQYNHRQQQLFAWPSLSVKPATYYFVLLPSGVDYEADSENIIDPSDVAANIIVEVIRPYTGSNAPSSKFDIDQLIDHKFSLEFLHRHPTYPLLLSQIISIFDLLLKTSSNGGAQASGIQGAQEPSAESTRVVLLGQQQPVTTANSILNVLQHSKQTRLQSNKLVQFLLIDSSATADGEYFSLTWTSHPSLVNNTVDLIHECRLATINETISRLSSRSVLYPTSANEKFVIPYSLDGPLANAQSIIPTERGNFALKLRLLNSCRDKRAVEELGLAIPSSASSPGFPVGIDYRANSVPDTPIETSTISGATIESSSQAAPGLRGKEATTTSSSGPIVISAGESSESLPGEYTEGPVTSSGITTEVNNLPTSAKPASPVAAPTTSTQPIKPSQSPAAPAIAYQSTEVAPPVFTDSYSPTVYSAAPVTTASSTIGSALRYPTRDHTPLVRTIEITTPTQIVPTKQVVTPPSPATATDQPSQITSRTNYAPVQAQTNTRRALGSASSPAAANFAHYQQQTNLPPPRGPIASISQDLQSNIRSTSFIMSQTNTSVSTDAPVTKVSITPGTKLSNNVTATTLGPVAATGNIASTIGVKSEQETSLNDDLIGILNEVMEFLVSVAVPLSIILGIVLIVCILFALCNLYAKRRKSKQFEVSDRFKFRYGSERKMFLKNRSKPVILEADQKSLSMGGTPQHKPLMTPMERNGNDTKKAPNKHKSKSTDKSKQYDNPADNGNFFAMSLFSGSDRHDEQAGSSGDRS